MARLEAKISSIERADRIADQSSIFSLPRDNMDPQRRLVESTTVSLSALPQDGEDSNHVIPTLSRRSQSDIDIMQARYFCVSIKGNRGPMVLHKCLALATCICSKSN